jgi:phosphoserine phosphatase
VRDHTFVCRAVDVVFFDLDGTLLRNTSASQLIADSLGDGRQFAEFEASYKAGRITNADVARVSASHLHGRTLSEVAEILGGGDWIAGIKDVTAALGRSGITSVLATISWDFVAEIVAARYGFAAWCGTPMRRHRGYLTGYAGQALEGRDKARFAAKICAERNVALAHAAAIGDSRSDVHIFKRVGYSIALNGDTHAKAVASVSCDTDDLRDVLSLLTPELDTTGGAQYTTSIG